MVTLQLAANTVFIGPINTGFGHLQIVFDDGVNPPQEIEVQGDGLLALFGNWVFEEVRDHEDPGFTPGFGDAQHYRTVTIATDDDAITQWNLLVSTRDQLVAQEDGQRFQYDLDYNSNTFANTLLSIVGLSVGELESNVTAPAISGGFPGGTRNALSDFEYPGDAIDLLLEGGDTDDSIFTGMGSDTLIGGAGEDNLHGGGGADALFGGLGNDFLWGEGGTDTMTGSLGDDVYIVENSGDSVVELVDEGTDTVLTLVDFVLPENVEQAALFGDATILTGNSLDNFLVANGGDATLNGLGGNDVLQGADGASILNGGDGDDTHISGSGAETMVGGAGNDAYFVGAGDVIVEAEDDGIDVTYSSLAFYSLAANVENGVLDGGMTLAGNDLDNTLVGDEGANLLRGLAGDDIIAAGDQNDLLFGGVGLDTLQSGSGDDMIIYGELNELGDNVVDFVSGSDSFVFDRDAFGFSVGETITLGENFFVDTFQIGLGPGFVFATAATALFYDGDGEGGQTAQLVADVQAFGNITANDIEFM